MDETTLSGEEIRVIRDLLDRTAISRLINDYYHALDSRNFALLENVFAEDAEFTVQMIEGPAIKMEGRKAVIAAATNVGMFRTSHHGIRNISIKIAGKRAEANIYAMDALIDDRKLAGDVAAGPRLIQHGLRYIDVLEKLPEGWRIKNRRLYCLWQDVTINPALLAEIPIPR